MTSENRSSRAAAQLQGHLRFYRISTLILLAVVIILSAVLIATGRQKFARAIRIDGDLVCLVKDQTARRGRGRCRARPRSSRSGATPPGRSRTGRS